MKKKIYIRSTGIISPQDTFGEAAGIDIHTIYNGSRMNAIEPDYKQIMDPKSIRRMSRIIRMGTAAALECMAHSGLTEPDAIITGTAYGCIEDTVIFLNKMIENKEELLTPTAFIQSTHNSVGAQIALTLKCHGYNNTFVHRDLSFEQALMDAILLLEEGDVKNVLVGGVDETTDTSHTILNRFGLYRKNANNINLLHSPGKGTMAGEGAGFFLLTAERSLQDVAVLDNLSMQFDPEGKLNVADWINEVLSEHQTSLDDFDLLVLGNNGDLKSDRKYDSLQKAMGDNSRITYFKHLCGEYPTASTFGLWLAATALKNRKLPFSTGAAHKLNTSGKVLLYNSGMSGNHSLMLLSAC